MMNDEGDISFYGDVRTAVIATRPAAGTGPLRIRRLPPVSTLQQRLYLCIFLFNNNNLKSAAPGPHTSRRSAARFCADVEGRRFSGFRGSSPGRFHLRSIQQRALWEGCALLPT